MWSTHTWSSCIFFPRDQLRVLLRYFQEREFLNLPTMPEERGDYKLNYFNAQGIYTKVYHPFDKRHVPPIIFQKKYQSLVVSWSRVYFIFNKNIMHAYFGVKILIVACFWRWNLNCITIRAKFLNFDCGSSWLCMSMISDHIFCRYSQLRQTPILTSVMIKIIRSLVMIGVYLIYLTQKPSKVRTFCTIQ